MKKMHLTKSALLAATMAMGFLPVTSAIQTFAADETNATTTITINNATEGKYFAYQLFTGDYTTVTDPDSQVTGTAFGNVSASSPAVRAAMTTALNKTLGGFSLDDKATDAAKDAAIAEAIAGLDADKLKTFAKELAKAVEDDGGIQPTATASESNGTVEFTVPQNGYYLILSNNKNGLDDEGGTVPKNNVATFPMLLQVGTSPVTANLKADEPTVEKQVKEKDGEYSDAVEVGAKDQKDSDVPVAVREHTYKITGTWSDRIEDYTRYTYKINDTLPLGMDVTLDELNSETGDNTWQVKITAFKSAKDTGTDVTSSFEPTISTADNGQYVITWTCEDLRPLLAGWTSDGLANGRIEVEYTPVFDENDVENLYKNGYAVDNPMTNTAYLEFSNNPYDEGTGKTPEDETKVYSYKLSLQKVDDSKEPQKLAGAVFELRDPDGNVVAVKTVTDDDGLFEWVGLESGTYTLVETQAPAGYKKIDPITFTITANIEGTELKSVTVTEDSDPSGAADFVTANESTIINLTVANVKGPNMPVTGQAGITIATIAGIGVLTLSVVSILKKKKENDA